MVKMQILSLKVSLLIAALFFLVPMLASAQPAGNRAIEEAYVDRSGNCSRINVDFVFPVQYLSHFPRERGEELQVQLRPLAIGNTDIGALIFNEPVRLSGDLSIELVRFDYMGDRYPADPYLLMASPHEFSFRVEQGEDFRSLVLFVTPGHISDCN
jgi:hypothetical protein